MRDFFTKAPLAQGGVRGRWPVVRQGLIAIIFFVTGGLLSGCAGSQPVPVPEAQTGQVVVAVIERDWHTEIGVLSSGVSGPLSKLHPLSAGGKYVVFGFGDRAYFSDHDAGAGKAFAALFPGPSAVQLATFDALPEDETHIVVRIHLSQEALDRIVAFVWDSLDKGDAETPWRVSEYGQQNVFYAGRLRYDSIYNCNAWTADALRAGGLPFDPSGIMFASEVMEQARKIASVQTAGTVKLTGQ
jgi:hypothetical protein